MKKIVVCTLVTMLCVHLFGQVSEFGWSYTKYPNGIVRLQWFDSAMKHTEQISDAVIAKPISKKFGIGTGQEAATIKVHSEHGFRQVTRSGNGGATVFLGQYFVNFLSAFDSVHHRGVQVQLKSGEMLFGGGERATPLNRRGQRIVLKNNPWYGYGLGADALNYSVPLLLSSEGYGLFFNNPSIGYLDVGKSNANVLEAGFESGAIDVYIIPGNSMDELLQNYTALTGRQPLPPRWAFGNLMSRFGYRSQQQLEEIVGKMKSDRIPIDAVILDLFWFGDSIKGTLGNLDWNRAKWPAPEKMISNLKKQNIHTILITEPFVLRNTKAYKTSIPFLATDSIGKPYMLQDFYFGKGGLIDLFRPQSQQWFWQFYKKQIGNGVAGWWGDLGEPEKHPADMYHNAKSFGVNRKMSANELHNMYGHQWSKMLWQQYAKAYPDTRLFYLNRAGFAGSQRFSIFPWTGDVSRSWDGLRAQLPILQSMSLSGIAYTHSDAGGFAGGENDPELYTRWLQFATFTPIFRPHGTAFGDLEPNVKNIPSEPTFQEEPYKSIVRNTIKLRYQLLPYNYNLAYEQTTTGRPLMRPMFFYNSTDTNLQNASDQYMWGDALLVAPILEANAKSRSVFLPTGSWYNFYNHQLFNGGTWVTDSVDINHIPVYVKGGSFIPVWNNDTATSTASYNMRKITTIRYYPAKGSSQYTLFDDDGKSRNSIDSGNYSVIELSANVSNDEIIILLKGKKWQTGQKRKIALEMAKTTDGIVFNRLVNYATLNKKLLDIKVKEKWRVVTFEFTGETTEIKITGSEW